MRSLIAKCRCLPLPWNSCETHAIKKLIALLLLPLGSVAWAEPVGEVDTVFKFIGPDHKIVVDTHDNPNVSGVTCYVSRAKTGALGVAEDKSEASIEGIAVRRTLSSFQSCRGVLVISSVVGALASTS